VALIFPMAGRGARFGGTFKPFLRFGGGTFIEAAVQPFRKWRAAISRVVFVFLEAQEREFHVRERLARMFDGLPWEAVLLPRPTDGPAETLAGAVEQAGITGAAIVCDCDHSVNVDPLFEALTADRAAACMLPVWNLAGEDVRSWSVAALADDGAVTAIAEKAVPPGATRAAGVIGCYYFRDVAGVVAACRRRGRLVISEAVSDLISAGQPVVAVPIQQASFFGDPERLAKAGGAAAPAGGSTSN
jgi:hypothetical protein